MGDIPMLPLEQFLASVNDPTGIIVQYKDLQFIDSAHSSQGLCGAGRRAVLVPPGFLHPCYGFFQIYEADKNAVQNRTLAIKHILEEYETWIMDCGEEPLPREQWLNRVVIQ